MELPANLAPADFDTRYRHEFLSWRPAVEEVASIHGILSDEVASFADGSNLVASVGGRFVIKIFPSFHRHQWDSERRVLPRFAGSIAGVRVPELIASGERDDGYTYVIISLLGGQSLEACWPRYTRDERASLMGQIGEVMAAAHALPVGDLDDLPPRWSEFLAAQIAGCRARHARLGMPAWIVDHLDTFIADALPPEMMRGRAILTGEYTPFNLLVEEGPRLCGMIDFGDAMIGPPIYDLLGPSSFLGGGDRALLLPLFERYGQFAPDMRMGLLALLLLHRYSNLDAQVRIPNWRARSGSLESLAHLIWP